MGTQILVNALTFYRLTSISLKNVNLYQLES